MPDLTPVHFYHPDAEQALFQAHHCLTSKQWQNALVYLARAYRADAGIASDVIFREILASLTGMSVATGLLYFADEQKLRYLIQTLAAGQSETKPSPRVSIWLVVITIFFSLMGLLSAGTTPIALMREFTQSIPEGTQHLRVGVRYQVFTPEGEPPAEGWRTLFVFPERGASEETFYRLFANAAAEHEFMLVVAEHRFYPQPYDRTVLPVIRAVLKDVRKRYPVYSEGIALAGIAEGGEMLSLYAQRYPAHVDTLLTFGATYLYPPVADYNTAYIYGTNDPFFENHSDENPRFATIADWKNALNYIMVEGAGRYAQRGQIPIFIELLENLYGV